MEKHYNMNDAEFAAAFENCTLKPAIFSHEAHLRLAWIHIHKYGVKGAIENIQNQLKNYVAYVGAEGKYHATITVGSIKAVYHFMLQSNSYNFKDFIAEFPRLKFNFKELMQAHYQIDIFKSAKAKSTYLEPDLLPFD